MSSPVVYVSPSCQHSRALIGLIKKTGFAEAYSFVNVDKAPRLPKFVDRVPLLYDGASVVTDSALFDMFTSPTSASATALPPSIAPLDSASSGAFVDALRLDDDSGSVEPVSTGAWLHSEQRIETPECEPMPKKE